MLIKKTTAMYKIEPIVLINDKISLPTCMFKVKNIHGGTIFSDISMTDTTEVKNSEVNQQVMRFLQRPLKELAMIEARQEKLLQQLEKLRNQMISMKQHFLNSSPQQKVEILVSKVAKNEHSLSRDVVIKASPTNLPHYLLSLQKLLGLKISCHTHSSVMNLPSSAKNFASKAEINNPVAPEMNIIIIWKEVGVHSQLLTSPTMSVVICADVNILRYIVAAIPSVLTYKAQLSSWEVDSLLDVCHKIQSQTNVKERQVLLRLLNSKLGKNQWLSGTSHISIADLAAWTIIKQRDYQNDLTSSMKSWFQKCEDCSSRCFIK